MRSVLFFTQNQWAFGQIHHALIKRLWERKIYAHLLDFYQEYTQQEFDCLKSRFEIWCTTPEAVQRLLNAGIPANRIVAIAHAERDLHGAIQNSGAGMFDGLKEFAVINQSLAGVAKSLGISREPKLVQNGIDFDHFYSPVSSQLRRVAYTGADVHPMWSGYNCKRPHLLAPVMDGMDLEFVKPPRMNHLCMGGFYPTIDAILVTSSYEACGLPALEAAAAGRLVVSAQVGYFNGHTGWLCRLPDAEYIEDARKGLSYMKEFPSLYVSACEFAQQYTREHFDWSITAPAWVELFD